MSSIYKFTSNRIPELDGIRGIALLMVLTYHFINNQLLLAEDPSALAIFIRKATFFTWSALDLFFVLSGFLIGKILIEHQKTKQLFFVFYFRRILRILPLFYLLLFCYVLLRYSGINDPEGFLFGNELPLWSYFVYVQNYMMVFSGTYGPRILTPTWSLGVDEQFYLILPFIIFLFKKKWLPYLLLPLIIAAPVLRAATDSFFMKILPFHTRMDGLFLGVLLAYLVCEHNLIARVQKKSKLVFSILVLLLLSIFLLTHYRSIGALDHSLFNVVFALLILSAISFRKGYYSKILSSKLLKFFGFVSYGTYLFHQFISGILHASLLNQQPKLNNIEDLAVTVLSLILALFIGYVLHLKVEKPLIQFGHRFKYRLVKSGKKVEES